MKRYATLEARFWQKVEKGDPDECWEWRGWRDDGGYGCISVRGRRVRSHRVVWELTDGPIPAGLCVCHTCDNPPCVNPAHLWLGTNADNVADKMAKGRHGTGRGLAHGRYTKPERTPRGEGHGRAKVTDVQVRAMRERHEAGATQIALDHEYGISSGVVNKIVNRKLWVHV